MASAMQEAFLEGLSIFLAAAYLVLSAANWWFDMVQRTAINIWRASSDVAPREYVNYLLPFFMRFAFLVTLAKWGVALAYGYIYHWEYAVGAIVAVWLAGISSPLPIRWTIPRIEKKIAQVESLDSMLARDLRSMVNIWYREGAKF